MVISEEEELGTLQQDINSNSLEYYKILKTANFCWRFFYIQNSVYLLKLKLTKL